MKRLRGSSCRPSSDGQPHAIGSGEVRPARFGVFTWLGLLAILTSTALPAPAAFGASRAFARSLDIALHDHGVSFGNSPRLTGIRVNAVDRGVEAVNGLNLTFWVPGPNPAATYNGAALALIGTKARRIHGVALGGIGVNASDRVHGIAVGTLGVASREFIGVAAGVGMVDIRERHRGLAISGIWTGNCERFDGLALGGGLAGAKNFRGIAAGALFAAGEESLRGLALGGAGVGAKDLRGLAIGGIGAGAKDLRGLVIGGAGVGGSRLDGILVAGLGIGAGERIRGIAATGVVVFAPEMKGISIGALNGFYVDRIDLEDFLHFDMTNERMTGLQIGLFNYTANLRGVQIGLLNYVGNNPKWARVLPFVNLRL